MHKPILLHPNYSLNQSGYQLKLPLNIETIIPKDDSVRLLSQFVQECEGLYGIKIVYGNHIQIRHLKKLRKKLYIIKVLEKWNRKEEIAASKKHGVFRRYLSRSRANVLAESTLMAMARNINKLHNKIQTSKTGQHLFKVKTA